MIMKLAPNEIFVFGSNTAGRHGRGAALQALQQFGAVYGVGEGLTGQTYAFPTLDGSNGKLIQLPHCALQASRDRLYECCEANPGKRFLLTKVGCGLAGYAEFEIVSLFSYPPHRPENLILPEDWEAK